MNAMEFACCRWRTGWQVTARIWKARVTIRRTPAHTVHNNKNFYGVAVLLGWH
jgi:hypothetical protein